MSILKISIIMSTIICAFLIPQKTTNPPDTKQPELKTAGSIDTKDFQTFLNLFDVIELPFDSETSVSESDASKVEKLNQNEITQSLSQFLPYMPSFQRMPITEFERIGRFELDEKTFAILIKESTISEHNNYHKYLMFCYTSDGERADKSGYKGLLLAEVNGHKRQSFTLNDNGIISVNTYNNKKQSITKSSKKSHSKNYTISESIELISLSPKETVNFEDFKNSFRQKNLQYDYEVNYTSDSKEAHRLTNYFISKGQLASSIQRNLNSNNAIKKFLQEKRLKFSRIGPPKITPRDMIEMNENELAFIYTKSYFFGGDKPEPVYISLFNTDGNLLKLWDSNLEKYVKHLNVSNPNEETLSALAIDNQGILTIKTDKGIREVRLKSDIPKMKSIKKISSFSQRA